MPKLLSPIHPGETIREDVLKPLDMSVNQLAQALAVDAARLNKNGPRQAWHYGRYRHAAAIAL